MKIFSAPELRNVAVVGHNTVGKTTLVAALLHAAGATTRPGRIEDGTCPTDFDGEEIERNISINLGVAHAIHRDVRVNFLDAPGYGIFSPEAHAAVAAADAVLIVLDAVSGVEVQTDKVWKFAAQFGRPVIFVVNRMDRERASFDRTMESLHKKYGRTVVPLQIPVGEEKAFRGTVDLVRMESHLTENGQRKDGPIPDELFGRAREEHEKLVEMVAEGDDTLMEKFFSQGTLEEADLLPGLQHEIAARKIFPVFCASSSLQIGVRRILDACVDLFPSPDGTKVEGTGRDGKPVEVVTDEKGHAVAQVVKTVSDPFAGRISYLRVRRGHFQSDGTYWNSSKSVPERFSGLFLPQGKEHVNVPEARAGDVVAVAKLKETETGDTLTVKEHPVVLAKLVVPEPAIAYAIEPKAKGDEDKISTALHKLIEEDPSLRFQRDEETKEFHLAGASQLHVEIAVARLKKRYGVEVILHPPKVPYRETITRRAEAHGRHKKQTGGHGQFADCKIKVEPLPRGADFEFVDEIYGGAIPRNYIPAVEKGIQDVRKKGFLAGYPMVDFRVILIDGQYHDVDSSELAFKIAGALAYKDAMEKARPTLLEPVMTIEINAPNEYVGDLMGDLSSRRGQVQGMESGEDETSIRALVPMGELLTYGAQLRSITQGRGSFHLEFSHYAEVPHSIQEKIIAQSKADKTAAEGA
ncbi:MAG: elongation factor G [Acidobacteria bacterium]|nr:MAG: elongation factor G [Acidobacteriota bacterium]PYQ66303.1 MAG: elongation factor G [Acidobacteriota bacterium]